MYIPEQNLAPLLPKVARLLICVPRRRDADPKLSIGLKDVLEEAASIVVILRLWRVFKIVEEFSAGASDQMEVLGEKMEKLEAENQGLKRELRALKDDDSGQ